MYLRAAFFGLLIVLGLVSASVSQVSAGAAAQQPTVSIPTVTGTQPGALITVRTDQDQVNVRAGPGTNYPQVGVLIAGEQASALGQSVSGLWLQIVDPGVPEGVAWVYSPLVSISVGSDLPILEPPPIPTPLVTPTIDPTLAAEFVLEVPATRLPTLTAPPPLVIPTYENSAAQPLAANLPSGLFITIFGVIGLTGAMVSLLRGR